MSLINRKTLYTYRDVINGFYCIWIHLLLLFLWDFTIRSPSRASAMNSFSLHVYRTRVKLYNMGLYEVPLQVTGQVTWGGEFGAVHRIRSLYT